jgi:oxygen-independent coproporphyrinogen-3 oxidase
MAEWVGLGPSAASQHSGWRGSNVADLDLWLERLGRGERGTEEWVALVPELLAEDAMIFGLRMNAGVDLDLWRRRAPEAPWDKVEVKLAQLEQSGRLIREGNNVRLTECGRLVADAVGAEVMEAFGR